ncbi:MAG: N-6 DNA methylase [Nocardioidaceae bacterium]
MRDEFVSGYELVDGTARLAAMNLLLHGIGTPNGDSLIDVRDSLIADPGQRWSVVLANPPFGRKSSLTMVGADGRAVREDRDIERQDFVVDDVQQAAQLPAAHHDDPRHQRPRRGRPARQRAVRGWRRRDAAPQAARRLRSAHDDPAPDRHLLRARV